jgi:hypothetical protein
MAPIVAPPYEIAQRAWECAYVLRGEFSDRLTLEQNIRAEVVLNAGPLHLSWAEIGDMTALYHLAVEVRV